MDTLTSGSADSRTDEGKNQDNSKEFTSEQQKRIDEILTQRLNREKEISARYKNELEVLKTTSEESIKSYEQNMKALITDKLDNLDEATKEAVSELPLSKQIEWLSKHGQNISKKTISGLSSKTDGDKSVEGRHQLRKI